MRKAQEVIVNVYAPWSEPSATTSSNCCSLAPMNKTPAKIKKKGDNATGARHVLTQPVRTSKNAKVLWILFKPRSLNLAIHFKPGFPSEDSKNEEEEFNKAKNTVTEFKISRNQAVPRLVRFSTPSASGNLRNKASKTA
ncbi:hypothetical protein WICPIJ_008001 [Wickerhamomyces pijperi]|uniref:Uncharacterized protein n=1 Tax=Wickerhamomyces pijperi TaxID=599730 RepID=A0A9P8PZ25_WICPI|nr:hypothetical protein WICPIJ_008001 [Wickerhamomyces pijperi]